MLIFQEWALDLEPSRQVIYDRMNRFVEHCKKLGIPNPYSTVEYCNADKRWHRLQKNAAPAIVDFMEVESYIDEIKRMKPVSLAANTRKNNDSDFDF